MKWMKRVAACCMALLFCVTALPVSAAATATVSVESVTAKAGETIVVPVNITAVENVASIEVHVSYDPAVLKCVEAHMSDAVSEISWSNVNTEPKGHPNEVWLTALGSASVTLEGMLMSITFEVLDTAPAGVSPIKLEKMTIIDPDLQQTAVDGTDGSVTIKGDAVDEPVQSTTANGTTASKESSATQTPQTTVQTTQSSSSASPQTTVQSVTEQTVTQASGTQASIAEQTVTSPNGETIVLPEETVVDIAGNIVTDASGVPTKVSSVAIMLENVTAAPNDTVVINVSLSAVAELTALGIAVSYDTDALTFEGGECVGFIKSSSGMASVTENKAGVVDISAITSKGMSGSGVIAQLHFKVKPTAKNGEYRVSVTGDPLLQVGNVELPTKIVAGEIRVEGAEERSAVGLYAAIGIIAVAVIAVVIVWIVLRRKKRPVPAAQDEKPAVVDVSGEDEK